MLIEGRPALDPELSALVVAEQRELHGSGSVLQDADHLVVVCDRRVVGTAAWHVVDTDVAEIVRVYVRPAYRGRGIGRQLVLAVEEEILAAGRAVVRLVTSGPAAAGFLDACGYPGGRAKRLTVPAR